MTTGLRYTTPYAYAPSTTGVPVPGATLEFFITSSSTVHANTYTDSALTTINPNPVTANSAGIFPSIFLDPTLVYRTVLSEPASLGGAQIWSADPVFAPNPTVSLLSVYLGPFSSDFYAESYATLQGIPLVDGIMYFNTTEFKLRIYSTDTDTWSDYDASAQAAAVTATDAANQASLYAAAAQAWASGNFFTNTTDPLTNGVLGIAMTANGTGGTNGTFTGTFTGGGGSGAQFQFVVASGSVVPASIVITNKGVGYTSTPTPVFTASTGLTGATATITTGPRTTSGDPLLVQGSGNTFAELYRNVSGVITDQNLAIPSLAALAAVSAALTAFENTLRQLTDIGQTSPVTPTTIIPTSADVWDVTFTDNKTLQKFWYNATSSGTITLIIYNRSGFLFSPSSSLVLNVTTGLNTFTDGVGGFSNTTILAGQYIGVYHNGKGGRTSNTAYGDGFWSGTGTGSWTDTVLTTNQRIEAGYEVSEQTVTATTFANEVSARQSADQKIDAMTRRLDYATRVEVVFGDSRAVQEMTVLGSTQVANVRGIGPWASITSSQLISAQPLLNQGIGGQNSSQFLARILNASWSNTGAIIRIPGFVNDAAQGLDSVTVTQPNILQIVTTLRNAGKYVILHDDYPPTTLTTPQMNQMVLTRDYIRSLHNPANGIACAFTWNLLAATPNGTVPLPNTLADGLHYNVYGASLMYPAVVTAWQALGFVSSRPLDTLATNLTINSAFSGVNGVVPSGGTGSVADGWSASLTDSGGTATFSKVTNAGYTWQRVVMGGTWLTSTPSIYISQDLDVSTFTAGDTVELFCMLNVTGATAGLRSITAGVFYQSGTLAGVDGYESPAQTFPTFSYSGMFGTRFVWPSGATRVTPIIQISTQINSPGVTVDFTNFLLHKVIP